MPKLTKSMAAPKTTMLRLKLRNTGEEVDTEIKLLPPTQLVEVFRKVGFKTASELQHLRDIGSLKVMSIVEEVCVQAVSVTERWTVEELRNTFDVQELERIFLTIVQSVPHGPTDAPRKPDQKTGGPYT